MISPAMIGSTEGKCIVSGLLDRFLDADSSCRQSVKEIIRAVKEKGDEAVLHYGRKFDAPELTAQQLQVSSVELKAAYEQVGDDFLNTIKRTIERIQAFHRREMEESWIVPRPDGSIVGRLVRPLDSAGLYVPGGKGGSTPLVSSVLMNGIPAGIAGVPRRVLASPPAANGLIAPHLLVAAQEIGITEIYKAGSAWAIAGLALGTETIPRVDVIVGPGNQFVAEAKRQVFGMVRIDMLAGPSEILIIADRTARAKDVAADMLAQAEHDPQALSILVTTHPPMAKEVLAELERQLALLDRREIAKKSLVDRGVILIASNIEAAVEVANSIAIEHLELIIDDPWAQLPYIRHAGAIFLGSSTPEAVGDYFAGPNHVLPTMGTARFASALGVETFLKKSSLISYSAGALVADGEHIMRLARLEGLEGHAGSVAVRLDR